ncbi:hypothetical protein NX722_13715 [Endozoicomonas gorgoniicola]|uniref:Mor transcription activator domain-containing protein n=1 Tax=Endozoicomonas gorgoniicola TaxID=1234144 RepID=A0ABT3MWB4_9GAMM|nr:hypothetical protein [Endozoicomonas gorgoniicola]MCW7553666.1 hypothetical protein [Endozoicomonas gorgoniicola]
MDAQQDVKRSTNQKYKDEHLQIPLLPEGVGARHKHSHPPLQGGGYLNICTDSEVCLPENSPASLSELAAMGVSRTWCNVASAIGTEAFLEVWQILDQSHDQGAELNGSIRVTVPRYERFLRYQRNRVIRSLANQGKNPADIQKYLKAEMNIDISLRTVQRIASKRRCTT